MGKETKFGLLVGVAFIVLFGVILGGRVGSAAGDHAPLPVGDSGDHQVLVDTILGSSDPLGSDERSLALDGPAPVRTGQVDGAPAEEPVPAPEETVPEGPAPEASEPAGDPPIGRLAFAPARVETPMPAPGVTDPPHQPDGPVDAAAHEPPASDPPTAAETPPAPQRPVHVVAKGETLTTIATHYYGADGPRLWRRIWEANKDTLPDPHRLDLGQSLVIPGLPTAPAPAGTQVAAAADEEPATDDEADPSVTLDDLARQFKVRLDEGDVVDDPAAPPSTYTVQKGDTFYSIARKVYGDASLASRLVRKNRDRVPDARRLRIGQTIRLLENVQTAARPDGPEAAVTQVAAR
ncbi:MAG: LysM peptidoglycan-binding domain-containing protein [Phycisphaerae bacterium]